MASFEIDAPPRSAGAVSLRDAPAFVLGAMLPDLSAMAGVRITRANDHAIARGIEHHHAIDHAFHACAPFVAHCSEGLQTLEDNGVARGAARAVAHVGSELLLDGALSTRSDAIAMYARALQHAIDSNAARDLEFRHEQSSESLRTMLARLQHAPLPQGYRDPAFVHARLITILSRRPRLALQAHERQPVLEWLQHVGPRIAADSESIIAAVRASAS